MIIREQKIEQSVQDFVQEALLARGYADAVTIRDSFPTMAERATEMKTTQLSTGFDFDDGGKNIELGSDLKQRIYTIEFWIFGVSESSGRNVAGTVRNILEDGHRIPLKDIGVDGQPVIDQLLVADERGIVVQRQVASDPRPWDRYVWTTTVKLEDVYYPSREEE